MRLLIIVLALVLLLTACARVAPPDNSATELPLKDVRVLQIAFYGENIHIRWDPAKTKEFPIFSCGLVSITLSDKLTPHAVALLPSGWQYWERGNYGNLPSIAILNPDLESLMLDIPDWLKDSEGKPIEGQGKLVFPPEHLISLFPQGHGSMAYGRGGSFPMTQGEGLSVKLHWPFKPSSVESVITSALSNIRHTLRWVAEDEIVLTVMDRASFSLDFRELEDIYGWRLEWAFGSDRVRFPDFKTYTLLRSINLTTGAESQYTLSPAVSGAWRVCPDHKLLTAYRSYYPGGDYNHGMRHDFVIDLSTGLVVSYEPIIAGWWTKGMKEAKALIEPHLPDGHALDYIISPSGTKAAAIHNSSGVGKAAYIKAAYILDVNLGQVVVHDIGSYNHTLQERHVLRWSYDERYLVYGTSESGKMLIYRIDVVTGERTLITGPARDAFGSLLRDVSTVSYHLVVGDKVLDFDGNVVLDLTGSHVDAWISPERFIVDGRIHDISTGTATGSRFPGRVFHYDPQSNTVFILDSRQLITRRAGQPLSIYRLPSGAREAPRHAVFGWAPQNIQ